MNNLAYTSHGEMRMQQRGTRKEDVDLILAYGTQIDDETWLMRVRDAKREIVARKREIQTLERLASRKVVMRNGNLITVYLSRPRDQKRTLRRARAKGLK